MASTKHMNDGMKEIQDAKRLEALRASGLMDSGSEEAFDRLTRLAARLLNVPVALISLVDDHRQYFKSSAFTAAAPAFPSETPLSHSFCKHVVVAAAPLAVSDVRQHEELKNNPAIQLGVIAYAGMPLMSRDGVVLGSFCAIDDKPHEWTQSQLDTLRDLTAAAATEIDLRLANEALRNADLAKDRFFAMLSHELRTPLSPALLTATHLSGDPAFPEKYRDEIQMIQRNIDLEVRMIDSLFDLTRIMTGKLTLHTEQVDSRQAVQNSIQMCHSDATGKSIQLVSDLQASQCVIKADSPKLQQVFCNLIKNAVKFSKCGDLVQIRSRDVAPDSILLEVIDSGQGITKAVLPTIFDAFEQGKRAVTQQFGGLGLGLAISRGIIEAHGGKITAHSEGTGKGTTMRIVLPHASVPLQPISKPERLPASFKSRGLDILLVDDHADTLRAMSRLLKTLEHRVTTATCVTGALAAADAGRFDLVISDVGLPDGTGLQLMEQLRSMYPLKGIALTGYGMESDIELTRKAGFQVHLTKPINFSDLQAAIQELE